MRPTVNRTARAAYRVFHLVSPLVVLAVGIPAGLLVLLQKGHEFCVYKTEYLPDFWLFALGAGAFFVGHFIGRFGNGQTHTITDASQKFGRLVIVTAFLVTSLILVFEALGTAEIAVGSTTPRQLEPITYYVRCAIEHDVDISGGLFTRMLITLTFFVAGNWFWPNRRRAATVVTPT
jgi:hypothetical protein